MKSKIEKIFSENVTEFKKFSYEPLHLNSGYTNENKITDFLQKEIDDLYIDNKTKI